MSIEIKNLSKKFNEVYAVKNVNFTIGTNKTIGLLGPNGCCLLYTSPSPRDKRQSRMPSSA